jgi:glutathione peroxidase
VQKLSAYDIPLTTLAGTPLEPAELRGRAALIVNVASRCGLTPQYEGLQRLYDRYRDRGLVVLGVPCDQFANQEPGSADEIAEFCSAEYNVTFPLTEKLSVNGYLRHPLFGLLTEVPDQVGTAGDVEWNFEKFLVSPRGEPVARFRPTTLPEDVEVTQAIEAHLPERFPPVWSTRPVQDVRVGDRVITPSGNELTVSRIEERFLDREDLICLIEDTAARWLAQPVRVTDDVQILS